MELLQLKYFIMVANLEHVSNAAEALHISQPSLSRTISNLEGELGYPLFNRIGRQIRLNEYGRIFLKHVERIFFELEEAQLELGEYHTSGNATISVATMDTDILPDIFNEFAADRSGVRFKRHFFDRQSINELIELRGVDIGVAEISGRMTDDGWKPLYDDELYVVMPASHRLAGNEYLIFEDIIHENLITFSSHFYIRQKLERLFLGNGVCPHIFYEDISPINVFRYLRRNGGVSFINRSILFKLMQDKEDISALLSGTKALPLRHRDSVWRIGYKISDSCGNSEIIGEFMQFALKAYQKKEADVKSLMRRLL